MIGRTISHYQVLDKLGSGGMGEIYKAQDARLNRMVAIKVLSRRAAGDEERRRRFIKEAQAASSLNHPNIITIYDILSDEESEYIVMEFVAGRTLTEMIPQGRHRRRQDAAIHRADFRCAGGGARRRHRASRPEARQHHGHRIGAREDSRFRPRQDDDHGADQRRHRDHRRRAADHGRVHHRHRQLHEPGAGRRQARRSAQRHLFVRRGDCTRCSPAPKPSSADSAVSTLTAILRDEVRPIAEFASGVPPELEEIVARSLRKDPAQRWQSMQDVHGMLMALRQKSDSGVLYATQIARPAKKKRSALALGLSSFVITSAIGGALFLARRSQQPAQTPPTQTARTAPAPAPPPVVTIAPAAPPPAVKKIEKSATAPVKPAPKPDNVLTNKGIIDMAEAKVSPTLMMDLIRSSKTKFDLSVPEIIRLTKAGVPEEVIGQMRDPLAPPKPKPEPPPARDEPPPGRGGRREQRVVVDMGRGLGSIPGMPPMPPFVSAQAPPGSVMLYGGLPLSLTLIDDIPLEPQPGMPLHFRVEQDLKVGGSLVISKGATVTGEILVAKPRPRFKLNPVDATDGTKIKVRASPGRNSQRNEQPVETAGYKYKEALAPAGTKYMGYIDGDQPVRSKSNGILAAFRPADGPTCTLRDMPLRYNEVRDKEAICDQSACLSCS